MKKQIPTWDIHATLIFGCIVFLGLIVLAFHGCDSILDPKPDTATVDAANIAAGGHPVGETSEPYKPTISSAEQQDNIDHDYCANKPHDRACRIRAKHPDWTLHICNEIADRKVEIGMTTEQTVAAWGRPRDINRTVTASSTSEQWIYRCEDCIEGSYLYFDDGIMTSFQDSK